MYLACFICILSMFDEKNPPERWLICDILTGTTKSALGHLHAVFWNKTNLVEKNICSVLHTRLKSYDNSHGFFVKGSFRVRSTNFLLNLRDPPPISMKFGTLADNA